MQYKYNVKLAKEISAQMGLNWNENATSITANGEQIENINLKELFEENPFATNIKVDIPKHMLYDNDYCVNSGKNLAAA